MNIVKSLKTLPSNEFNWIGSTGYIAASDMPEELGITDSFAVRSGRTGEYRLFNFSHANHDCDPNRTVLSWIFDAADTDNFITITVLNDYDYPPEAVPEWIA